MFSKEILEKYADVMIWGLETARKTTGGEVKEGDIILVKYELKSLGLMEILHRKLVERGMHTVPRLALTPKMEFDFFSVASDEQLRFMAPGSKELFRRLNGYIGLWAPSALTHLKSIDPKKQQIPALAFKPLREIMQKREDNGDFGWTLCEMPTAALARQAKLSLKDYAAEILRACYLDKDDPVGAWQDLYEKVTAIKQWLNQLSIGWVHVESANTDLKVNIGEKRQWLGVSGHNIPSFEIFTSPDWKGAEGVYFANMPSLRSGNYVEGVRLIFKNGRAVKIEAKKGEKLTQALMNTDVGARSIGEFSLTDKRFSPIRKFMASTLYDENVGGEFGNCHIAVGASYPDTYAGNTKELTKALKKKLGFNDSAIHWDLINTEDKRVVAYLKDGSKLVIYEDGMFRN